MNGYEFASRLYDIRQETGNKVTSHCVLTNRTKDLDWKDVLAASKEAIDFGLVERIYLSGGGGTRISYRLTRAGFKREYQRRYQRVREAKLKAAGVCINCGSKEVVKGQGVRCGPCAKRARERTREFQRNRRKALKPFNVCPVCCTREVMYDPKTNQFLSQCGYCAERDAESKERKHERSLVQVG